MDAKKAREIADNVNQNRTKQGYDNLFINIKSAAHNGCYYLVVGFNHKLWDFLVQKGFALHTGTNDPGMMTIGWKNITDIDVNDTPISLAC